MDADSEARGASEDSLAPTEELPQLESSNMEESDDADETADDSQAPDEDEESGEIEPVQPETEGEGISHTEDSNQEEPSNVDDDVVDEEEDPAPDAEYDEENEDAVDNDVEGEEEEEILENTEGNAGLEEEEEEAEEDENEGEDLDESNEEKPEEPSEPTADDSADMEIDTDANKDNEDSRGPSEQIDSVVTRKRTASLSSTEDGPRRKVGRSASTSSGDSTHDKYCWVCHKEGVFFQCKICPRSYHARCMSLPDAEASNSEGDGTTNKTCICPECVVVMNAENVDSRSEAMKMLNMDQLIGMLKSICTRMKVTPGAEPFLKPVLATDAADYYDYIIYPMDIFTLEKNIKQRQYGSTEAFLADAQWLVHNSIVFNSSSSPYTAAAKRLLKICKQELSEIETCPECYTNAHTKTDTWFIEACKRPHILVWAKLKGFPFWPAKAMKVKDDQVDVRFFGQHDRAWVSMKDCFYYSEEMPVSPPKKNGPLLSAIEVMKQCELTAHVDRLKEVYGRVIFQSVRTQLTSLSLENIQRMLPDFQPEEPSQHRTSVQVNPNKKAQLSVKAGKSPVTITISSLKTNPTIVSNSVNDGAVKVATRGKKATAEDSPSSTPSKPEDVKEEDEKEEEDEEEELPKESKIEEVKEKKQETPELDLRPPSGEILANALGLRRIVRKPSKEENPAEGETSGENKTSDAQESQAEKRVTRGLNKSVVEEDSSSREHAPAEGIVLRKSLRVSSKEKEKEPPVVIKGEPPDAVEEDEESHEKNSATKAFMEQLTSHGHNKPGYRFNISKDISISAVGDAAESNKSSSKMIGNNAGANKQVRRSNVGMGNINPRAPPIILPQGMQVQVTGQNVSAAAAGAPNKPRLVTTPNNQRFIMKDGQIRQIARPGARPMTGNIRPGNIRMNSGNQRQMGGMQQLNVRHSSIQNLKGNRDKDNSHHPIVVDSTSLRIENQGSSGHYTTANAGNSTVASAIQVNQVQSLQGAITLPGGTITVTPLSTLLASGVSNISAYTTANSVNGGNTLVALKSNASNASNLGLLNVQSNSATTTVNANGLPISFVTQDNPSITATPINSMTKTNKNQMGQQRRNISITLPPSVGIQMQNFAKNVTELVKSTVEQIAVDIIENGSGSKADLKAMQQEIEKIQIKYSKEIVDMKHNHDIAMRELRISLENDKKRVVAEVKRHMEQEKQKAIDEAKKKQWCANCGREALFYCCWNTSYCGYSCQEDHWPSHMGTCTQNNAGGAR